MGIALYAFQLMNTGANVFVGIVFAIIWLIWNILYYYLSFLLFLLFFISIIYIILGIFAFKISILCLTKYRNVVSIFFFLNIPLFLYSLAIFIFLIVYHFYLDIYSKIILVMFYMVSNVICFFEGAHTVYYSPLKFVLPIFLLFKFNVQIF